MAKTDPELCLGRNGLIVNEFFNDLLVQFDGPLEIPIYFLFLDGSTEQYTRIFGFLGDPYHGKTNS
ncbi:hypothetical protein ACFLT9_02120 [Acidobacteriota bacterium]